MMPEFVFRFLKFHIILASLLSFGIVYFLLVDEIALQRIISETANLGLEGLNWPQGFSKN